MLSLPRSDDEKVIIPLAPDAANTFAEWIVDNDADIRESAGLYASWAGKARGLVLQMALVIEYLAWADGGDREPVTVCEASVVKAMALVDEFLKPHARRVFGDAALAPVEKHAATLARYICKTSAQRINARDVRRESGIPGLNIAADVDAATEALCEAGWLRPAPLRAGGSPGRRSKDFLVNPAVHGVSHA